MNIIIKLIFYFIVTLILSLLFIRHRYNGDLGEAMYQLLPYVPSEYFQFIGVWYVWGDTCIVLPTLRKLGVMKPALQCRQKPGEEDDLWVVVATNKGGSILAARASIDIAELCGLCYGFGYRHHGNWNPPDREELPTYESQLYPAIPNVHGWEKYAFQKPNRRRIRCVVFSRDPFARFQSLFQYAIDAGEFGLRSASIVLNNMTRGAGAGPDVQENMDRAIDWMFESFGKVSMEDTHQHLIKSLSLPECRKHHLSFDALTSKFDEEVTKWLMDGWGITSPNILQEILSVIQRHDLTRKSLLERAQDHHVSGGWMNKEQKLAVKKAIQGNVKVYSLLEKQKRELAALH
jgi:hypothetical protein